MSLPQKNTCGSAALAALIAVAILVPTPGAGPFHRGDVNDDGLLNITDPVNLLNDLFLCTRVLPCREAADANNDASINITDAIYLLNFLFLGGAPPAAPGPVGQPCGLDPDPGGGPGDLGCASYTSCEDPGPAEEEFEDLIASYGILRTLAGKGEFRSRGFNGWDPTFEGGPAVAAELSRPHFAMADNAGNIYIADKGAHAIRKVSPDGKIVTVAGTGDAGDDGDEPGPATERHLSFPNGLWVRGDGTVYIVDLGNSKIRRLDPEGELTTLFSVPGGLPAGRGLWVNDSETLVYAAAGTEVKRWTPEDGVETYAAGFANLGNLVVDPAGDLVVTDRGLSRVYRIGEDRTPVPIAGNGQSFGGGDGEPALETAVYGVRGVWFLDTGGYLLATHEGSQVWYVDTHGYIHLFLNGAQDSHSGDGESFRSPGFKVSEVRAVCTDGAGNILITENDAGFIRVIEHE